VPLQHSHPIQGQPWVSSCEMVRVSVIDACKRDRAPLSKGSAYLPARQNAVGV
jgi:hypothetical protein